MSLLAGGDFDGDTVIVTWHPDIVHSFTNADVKFADPPSGFGDLLEKPGETANEILQRIGNQPPEEQRREFQISFFSGCTVDYFVGQFSNIADKLAYEKG